MTQPASPALSLWQNLVAAHNSFAQAPREFLTNGGDRIAVLRPALRGPERATALVVARSLSQAELSQLFPELVPCP